MAEAECIALIELLNGASRRAELHWYEAHGIGRKEVKRKRYVDYPASLELHKIYCVVADQDAVEAGDLRVVDDSGDDYLRTARSFRPH